MLRKVACWWVGAILIAACGGRSTSYDEEPRGASGTSSGGTGSAAGVSGAPVSGAPGMSGAPGTGAAAMGGADGASAGTGGRTMVPPPPSEGGEPSLPSGGTAACPGFPTECSSSDDVVYVGGVELRYPGPGSCGQCDAACATCDIGCKLAITVVPRCTGNRVLLFACSSLDERATCLNTLARDPYYVDGLGKRWSVVALTATAPEQFSQVGSRMGSLSLTVTDGVTEQVMSVAVLACNTEKFQFLPC